jgi:archease protein family (MTH1598/TM1083)
LAPGRAAAYFARFHTSSAFPPPDAAELVYFISSPVRAGEIAKAQPERTDAFEIEAPDREALLVDWLSELLYRTCSEYHAYVEFCVREMSDRRLVATAGVVSAEAIDDIKAVTHHELSIRARDGRRRLGSDCSFRYLTERLCVRYRSPTSSRLHPLYGRFRAASATTCA